jgi:hypothetical protein
MVFLPSASLFLGCVITLFASAGPRAQAPARLEGRVVTSDATPQPVRRAIVTLTGGELATNVSAVTDDDGRFAMANLRPGRYTLTASKIAFVTTAYGARRPGRPGTPVTLAAGENRADLVVVLPRGAVITGVVRDLAGEPAPNIPVTIARADLMTSLGGSVSLLDRLVTDDRGVYRGYGLAPGEYVVAAIPSEQDLVGITRLSRAELEATLRRLEQPPSGGARGAAAPTAPARAALAYAPVFHPGTPLAQEATRIRVASGEERTGMDFTMDLVATARVEGTIANADGTPVSSTVRISITASGPPLPFQSNPQLTRPAGQPNAFAYPSVTPGRYVLLARAGGTGPPGAAGRITSGGALDALTSDTLFAMAEITVSGSDVLGVTLTLQPGMTITGRVRFEGLSLTPPASLSQVQVGLTSANPSTTLVSGARSFDVTLPSPAVVQADGTFRIIGILPGVYGVSASVPGASGSAGWWVKSVMIDGRDVLDHPLALGAGGGDLTGAIVTLSDRHSELSGALQTPSGDPANEYFVVVFPSDRALWRAGARRIRATRPASDGRFSVVDLPAGEYLMAALTDVEPDEWQQPAFLEQLVAASVKVTIGDGAKVRQDLRIQR